MEKDIVIFSSVFADKEETYTQEQLEETQGIPIPFHNKEDYIGQIAVNLSNVIGFEEGQCSFNDQTLNCIYAEYNKPNEYTRNLLISKEEFREMLEYVHSIKIPKASEYLKQIRDASSKKVN